MPLAELDLASRAFRTDNRPRVGGLLAAPIAFPHLNDHLCHDHKAIRRRPDRALPHQTAVDHGRPQPSANTVDRFERSFSARS
jgi:hypothetical protein